MVREVEGRSPSETAAGLALGEEAVKTRLHRARVMLRGAITQRLGSVSAQTFQFHATRCDRVVTAARTRMLRPGHNSPEKRRIASCPRLASHQEARDSDRTFFSRSV